MLAFVTAFAQSPVLRPDPADFSQISGFRPDWCTERVRPRTVKAICFGQSKFQEAKSVRSVLVRRLQADELYVEDDWPGVELLKPRFGVIGPVAPSALGVESGEVTLQLNAEGAEAGLIFTTPSLGTMHAWR